MFQDYKDRLKECVSNGDTESAHGTADGILCEIALDTELTKEQREELVALYVEVDKWYA